ncbi:hypothetical protein OS493_027669 [Desmophyllum pertusum]|uniref:Uncharacterized protein n=1 Tax=Desmophyllum pertusum TaxID=174260 RepID=A0A9X0D3H9_9CNID|nr:hypothetical protein OS493_027669 [Desmophyllum pertusum]
MKLAFLLLVAFLLLSVTDGRSIMSATEKFLQGESERKSEIWQPLIGLRGLPSTEDSRGANFESSGVETGTGDKAGEPLETGSSAGISPI